MDGATQDLRYYCARFDALSIEKWMFGILTSVKGGPNTVVQTVVQRASRQFILEQALGSHSGVHFGVQKTIDNIKERVN